MQEINRREFIQKASLATAALTLPKVSIGGVETKMGIVVHSYAFRWNSKTPSKNYPGFATAIDLLQHTYDIGGAGVQVMVDNWAPDFAKKVRDHREKLGLYLEGSIKWPMNESEMARFEQEAVNAREAGATILRTVVSTGRRYEGHKDSNEASAFMKTFFDTIQSVEKIAKKNRVRIAIENHKDWMASEMSGMMKLMDNFWVGVTVDFGNNIALCEEPMYVVEKLAPYAISTHVKDMAVEEYADGFLLSEVPLGQGMLDLEKMFALCRQKNPRVSFNLEMITRDPLQVPILTSDYWNQFSDRKAEEEREATMKMVRDKQKKLPRVSQFDKEKQLAVEETNVVQCLEYSKVKLK